MARGVSLSIGINHVDPMIYPGWAGDLEVAERDARDMRGLLRAAGFRTTVLLGKHATRDHVINAISQQARSLSAGDIFALTFSGHGSQIVDSNGDEKPDGMDETWCLYDGELVDDKIAALFGEFAAGVRILLISDSCHSGSIYQMMPAAAPGALVSRAMPQEVRLAMDTRFGAHYKQEQIQLGGGDGPNNRLRVRASVLSIAACRDDQDAQEGPHNGIFTGILKTVWNEGHFVGNYRRFVQQIAKRSPPSQNPLLAPSGRRNPQFKAERPFTITDAPHLGFIGPRPGAERPLTT